MRRLLAESTTLFAAILCGSLLIPSAGSATLSGSVQTEVRLPPDFTPDTCSNSQSVSGPSVSLGLECVNGVAAALMGGQATDVSGQVSFLLFAEPDQFAEVSVEAIASGFFFIAVPSSAVDIRFNAIDCSFCSLDMTANGVVGDPTGFENLPAYAPIPYALDMSASASNFLVTIDDSLSYDLRSVTVRDHASGETLENARILFSATPVPEPGAAGLCCIGLALIALGYRSRARTK